MEFTGERFIPNISGEEIEIEHIQRRNMQDKFFISTLR